jgi:hypothetical protein
MARLGNLLTASATADPERSSIWSVPRPFIRLYLVLFTIQAGWLLSIIVRDVLENHGSGRWETIAYETLRGLSQPGVGVAITSLLVVEGISYVMVMYNLWMDLLVRPIVKRHERRGEARGIAIGEARGVAIGEARVSQQWEEWNRRRIDAEARGEAFTQPPPSRQPED